MNRRNVLSVSAATVLGLAMMPGSAVSQQKTLKEQLVGNWTFVSSINLVGQRQVGIVKSFSGTIGNQPTGHGTVFVAPWTSVIREDIGIQREDAPGGLRRRVDLHFAVRRRLN